MDDWVLIKLQANYADEFDVDSFWVTTLEDYNNFLKELKNKEFDESGSVDIYFGTNECISFTSIQEILDSLTVTDISAEFAWLLRKHFGEEYGLLSISEIPEYLL